jgi:tripartite ATP-independent transporter DctM subunit
VILVSLYIGVRCYFQPNLGPSLPPEERGDWPEKLRALGSVILPIGNVILVLGSIFGGLATPTEAAAIGVFGAILASIINGQFSLTVLSEACIRTFRLTAMVMWILFAAHAFSTAYNAMGAQDFITEIMNLIPGGAWGALAAILFVLFLLGMVLDPVGIMLITLPVFLPIIESHGFDAIWFGVIFIVMMEIGYMTPPFGFNLFYLKGVAPPGVTMGDIYRSVIPYTLVEFVGLLILIAFPALVLWLPGLLY